MTTDNQPEEQVKPPRATPQELEDDMPEPSIHPPKISRRMNMGGTNILQTILVAVIVSIMVFFGMGIAGGGSYVTKKDFTNNIQGLVASIDKAKVDISAGQTAVNNAVAALPNKVNDTVASSMGLVNNNINTLSDKVTQAEAKANEAISKSTDVSNIRADIANLNSTVDKIKNELGTLTTTVTDVQTTLNTVNANYTALEERVKALETPPTPVTTPGTGLPTGFSVKVNVLSEGNLIRESGNVTRGEIKLIITNNTGKDMEDLRLDLMVTVDYCRGYTSGDCYINGVTGVGYGNWGITDMYMGEMLIRGKINTLDNGDTAKVYITIESYAQDYKNGGKTILDTSSSDVTLKSYDYVS